MTDTPITVTLTDGSVIAFVDYHYTHATAGTRLDPPEPPEIEVHEARWVTPPEVPLSAWALWHLHNSDDYDLVLTAVQEIEEGKRAAAMDCGDEDDEP